MDSAERRSLAGLAGEVSTCLDVLEAVAGLGGAGRLAGYLARVPWTISLARKTFSHIRQNLFWAFFYNVVAMVLAAAGWLQPVMAAAAILFSSVMEVGNSLRLGKAAGLPALARPAAASPPAQTAPATP